EDLSGVDWDRVLGRYLPLVDRITTRSEFSDLLWELQGELGTSHAYERGGEYRWGPHYEQGFLGADWTFDSAAGGYPGARPGPRAPPGPPPPPSPPASTSALATCSWRSMGSGWGRRSRLVSAW